MYTLQDNCPNVVGDVFLLIQYRSHFYDGQTFLGVISYSFSSFFYDISFVSSLVFSVVELFCCMERKICIARKSFCCFASACLVSFDFDGYHFYFL
jgi:hypothetical protein